MADIRTETRTLIEAALAGDPALASLSIVGITPDDLTATIAPGVPTARIGGITWSPAPPFTREDLVEVIVRMQRTRWRRFDAFTLSIPEIDHDEMRERLARHEALTFDSRMLWLECGPGWCDLLDATLGWIAEAQPRAWWKASQIKEKFGTLRIYSNASSAWISSVIDAAEHLSGHVCDVCGAPGRTRGRGWVSTRCDDHREEGDDQ